MWVPSSSAPVTWRKYPRRKHIPEHQPGPSMSTSVNAIVVAVDSNHLELRFLLPRMEAGSVENTRVELVSPSCKPGALPVELIPHMVLCKCTKSTVSMSRRTWWRRRELHSPRRRARSSRHCGTCVPMCFLQEDNTTKASRLSNYSSCDTLKNDVSDDVPVVKVSAPLEAQELF